MRRYALLLAAALTALAAGAFAQEPQLSLSDRRMERGGVVSGMILFSQPEAAPVSVILRDPEGRKVQAVAAFPWNGGLRRWCFLMGLASSLTEGTYTVELAAEEHRPETPPAVPLVVAPRTFAHQRIALNGHLTELLVEPDPRKQEESRRLWELLTAADLGVRLQTGPFVLPVEGARRTSRYGDRRDYRYTDGGSSSSLHNGEDMAAPSGTPVVACGTGIVRLVEERLITGNTVVLEHLPGVYSLYYHLQKAEVSAGQRVERGQRIGTVGETGLATGPHLHWELRVGGAAVDPRLFLEKPLLDKREWIDHIRRVHNLR